MKCVSRFGIYTKEEFKNELAKQNGPWSILDTVESSEIPNDLDAEFN
jgi:hypothetical protein